MKPFIYALVDEADPKHVRYVGLSQTRPSRPYDHWKNAITTKRKKNPALTEWILSLHAEGRKYLVLILEELADDAQSRLVGFVERCYIKALRETGHQLLNITEGGGSCAPVTLETRAKQARAKQGTKQSEETKVKRRESIIRHYAEHPEKRVRQAERMLGNLHADGSKHSSVVRASRGEKLRSYYAEHPEKREQLSVTLKAYHAEHPESNKNAANTRWGNT